MILIADYLMTLALAVLPILGTYAGAAVAETVTVSRRVTSFALHTAAGVALAVVAVELLPQALGAERPWLMIAAFAAGGVAYVGLDAMTGMLEHRAGEPEGRDAGAGARRSAPLLIAAGVGIDLFSDGLMVGTGATVSLGLGLLLALAQVPANLPGGFAASATLKRSGVTPLRRRLAILLLALPVVIGVSVGHFAVRGQPDVVKFALLAFTSGILATVVVEELAPEADRFADARVAALYFVGGFALFALLSTYVG